MNATKVCMVVVLCYMALLSQINSQTVNINLNIPEVIAEYGKNKVDEWFSCSRYDGVAGCWHNKADVRDMACPNREKHFMYIPWFEGKCYCCSRV